MTTHYTELQRKRRWASTYWFLPGEGKSKQLGAVSICSSSFTQFITLDLLGQVKIDITCPNKPPQSLPLLKKEWEVEEACLPRSSPPDLGLQSPTSLGTTGSRGEEQTPRKNSQLTIPQAPLFLPKTRLPSLGSSDAGCNA